MKLLLVLLALSIPTVASARTWDVRQDGTGDAPSVQAAIDSASVGDVVLVGPGTYFENLDFLGKDITVRSDLGPAVTILDGSTRDSSVVVFKRGETRSAVLEGFTVTGGTGSLMARKTSGREGGGINCHEGSPTIRGNRILENRTLGFADHGGGMLVGTAFSDSRWSEPLIEGNLFEDNDSAGNGGALGCMGPSNAIVRGNIFQRNRCRSDGGAIWVWLGAGTITIEDNEFWENVAGDHGGGVHAAAFGISEPYRVTGNLFVRNQTTGDGRTAISGGSGGGIAARKMRGTIERNTLVANDGQHVSNDGGGGLLLYATTTGLRVVGNVIACSKQGGIACWGGGTATMGPNLLWQNEGGDLGSGLGTCPEEWLDMLMVADPLFCGLAVDDYRVRADSPALTGEEVMGRYGEPGCGLVPVEPITWGQLKSRYR